MKYHLSIWFLLLAKVVCCQDLETIQARLESLSEENMVLRTQVSTVISEFGFESKEMQSFNKEILKFDSVALDYAISVIEEYGWLGRSDIGKQANETLFVLIQHAQDVKVLETYFPLLEASAEKGESSKASAATMKDRILVRQGKKQLYGTQSRMVDGKLALYPVEDPENLKKRRKKVGLGRL
ncbi:MAG: hypothetical protein HRT61_02480 [Ekhidna sp.]|nr:hypothetical protein [Ekhidna sp.]